MNTEKLRFDNLPEEIVHSVAIRCDGHAALALCGVSKSIRKICYSWLVFKSITLSLLFRISPDEVLAPPDLGHHSKLFRFGELSVILGNRAQSWARYAVAATEMMDLEKALQRTNKHSRYTSSSRMEEYLRYIPQLSCLQYTPHHPVCATIDFVEAAVHASRGQGRLSHHRGVFGVPMPCSAWLEPALSFSFAIEILRGDLRQRTALIYKETGQFLDPRGVTLSSLLEELVSMQERRGRQRLSAAGSHVIVATFAYFLVLRDGEPHPFYRPDVKPPAVARLPLLDAALCRFSPRRCDPLHNAAAAEPRAPQPGDVEAIQRLIEGGEWCGYYAHTGSVARAVTHGDAPMQHVRLTLVPMSPGSEAIISGEGVDGVGTFNIAGSIQVGAADEKPFMMRKRYTGPQRHSWAWDGFLTPFGFVGFWGGAAGWGDTRVFGVFWLWRSDWQPAGS